MATVPTTLSEPILVANLPLPQDLAAVLDSHWRACRYSASERVLLEEDAKLRHHYAGHFVVATAGPPGLQIHAIDLHDPDQIRQLTQRLHAQGYRHVEHLYPIPLYSTDSEIITLNPVS
jgi:hypothetical protein